MSFIPYGKQDISEEDIQAVVSVLESNFLTQGPQVPRFEESLTDLTGAKFAKAVNSATSALHIACLALEVGPGDIVWTSPITFVASANCALYCGADVDFVDIDPETFNMCPVHLEQKLRLAQASGRLPKVVIVVHLCGQSADMESIKSLSKQYGFNIIEDASHCIGGKYKNRFIGSCQYSDITVFSFHPVKIITTAEGGAALTNEPALAQRLDLFRSHGVTRDESLMSEASHGDWYYQQVDLGFNYRMTEMQAALGVSQMLRVGQFVEQRNKLAARYNDLLSGLPIVLPSCIEDAYSAFHLYVIQLDLSCLQLTRREIFKKLREAGLGVNVHYIPVHTQPYYQSLGFKEGDFPKAEAYYKRAISLPLFHGMTEEEQDRVVEVLTEVLE